MNPPRDTRIVVMATTLIVQNGLRLVIMLKQLRLGRELVESIQNFARNPNKATRASGNDLGTPGGPLGTPREPLVVPLGSPRGALWDP